jgi:hypothetical protein
MKKLLLLLKVKIIFNFLLETVIVVAKIFIQNLKTCKMMVRKIIVKWIILGRE